MSTTSAEPTVYETPDSVPDPDPEPAPPEYEYDSEYIVSDKIDPHASRNHFSGEATRKGTAISGQFRPHISRSAGLDETKHEKITRLKREIEELTIDDEPATEADLLRGLLVSATDGLKADKNDLHKEYSSPSISSLSLEKLSLLENRVATLESRLTGATSINLSSTVGILQSKIDIAVSTPESIAQIRTKLQDLAQCATNLEESEMSINITELHRSLEKINHDLPSLTPIIDRLKSLQRIHEDASEVYTSCELIRQSLTSRSHEILAWQASLTKVESQIETSGQILTGNTDILLKIRDQLRPLPQG